MPQNSSPKVIILWRTRLLLLLVPLVCLTVLAVRFFGAAAAIPAVIFISLDLWLALAFTQTFYESMTYSCRRGWLRIERGVISRSASIVPRRQIQFVSLTRTPLERRLGVCTLVFHTPGGRVRVFGLEESEAERLRTLFDRRVMQ